MIKRLMQFFTVTIIISFSGLFLFGDPDVAPLSKFSFFTFTIGFLSICALTTLAVFSAFFWFREKS